MSQNPVNHSYLSHQYGRLALEAVMKSVLDMQADAYGVAAPKSYEGDFFKGLFTLLKDKQVISHLEDYNRFCLMT